MKKSGSIIKMIMFSLATLLVACGHDSFQTMPSKISDFKGILIGQKDSITSYRTQKGEATLIVLTASWCPACQAEVPSLKEISLDYTNRGLKILLISEDDSPTIAARYKKKAELPWTMIHWNYDIMNALGNPGVLPVSYLVNQQDSIVKVNVGIFDKNEMRYQLDKILR
ncbi:Thiol-disulfide isomerase or thioredoxin [Fibrobacter sp. UWH9]|uniref:TlpA family protein disulfide reductase n=1 Tax=Fibrobacter sp. UWH9 TaxID=1896213 RepID=UPI000922DD97|nr:TlpA disulfide reductase family protein [Fibrobacter sp. UWH9]SHH87044.1 Thiol-disulfide isomerase or thioredoxin [Fibrobacter sp. UWH9]